MYLQMKAKGSMLCVGLDTDYAKIPECVKAGRSVGEAVLEFNRRIIDATASHCVAYKPNLAFYESLGIEGLSVLDKTVDYLRTNHPEQFLIADAKRGDIGNTAKMYARSLFSTFDFDAVTISPYMGRSYSSGRISDGILYKDPSDPFEQRTLQKSRKGV